MRLTLLEENSHWASSTRNSSCKSELLVLRVSLGLLLVERRRGTTAVACFLRGLASGVHARQRVFSAVRLTIARLTRGWAICRHFTPVAKVGFTTVDLGT